MTATRLAKSLSVSTPFYSHSLNSGSNAQTFLRTPVDVSDNSTANPTQQLIGWFQALNRSDVQEGSILLILDYYDSAKTEVQRSLHPDLTASTIPQNFMQSTMGILAKLPQGKLPLSLSNALFHGGDKNQLRQLKPAAELTDLLLAHEHAAEFLLNACSTWSTLLALVCIV